jgi:biopolymer transport protein ExbB
MNLVRQFTGLTTYNRLLVILSLTVLMVGVVVQCAPAQENNKAAPAENAPAAPDNLLAATYEGLGPIYTVVFLLMSFWLVSMLVMNILAVRRENICPPDLIENVEKSLAENNTQAAVEMIQSDDSLLAQIVSAGLGKLEKGYDHAIEAMQQTGEEEVMKIDHRLGMMALIGNTAPMVGLLGTVQGMVATFSEIAKRTTTPPPNVLAKGISMALYTTLVGLVLAIPAIMLYNIIRNRFQRLVLQAGNASEELLEKFE